MKDYLLRLTERRVVVRLPTARDAYSWLDRYGSHGEPYRLSLADPDPRKMRIIDEGVDQGRSVGEVPPLERE
jgi:hypothetical protein